MTQLQQIQQQFLKALTDFDQQNPTSFLELIENSTTLSASQRLLIYQDSLIESFITVLLDAFPVCRKIVADEFFRFMAKQYIYQTPSNSPDLGEYGASFADFIAYFTPAQSLPYLADVVHLEWLWAQALRGENNMPFDLNALTKIDAEEQGEIIFQLPKNSYLLNSKFPITRIWEIHQENYTGEFSVDFNINDEKLFIYKIDQYVHSKKLTTPEWLLLQKIKEQKKLKEFNTEELNLLPKVMAQGLIGGITIQKLSLN